ncbi:MAG: hypothetical protein KAS96_00575 [Planctomycetes bacterium]|nr:hypothetical protein [Planctomycetota bacterium]
MKKLVLVLAVLIVSLPAMAAVTITADCNDGVYTVSYATDGNLPRAFALDITVATGTIDAVGGLSADYDIYPGSIVIIDGDVNDPGSAVCDDSYPDTLGGIGTAGITVEMGSLYADGDPAPAASGILFTFTTSEAETVATVTENGIRGGLVMEDPEEPIVPTITVVDCEGGCATCPGDMIGTTEVIDLSDLTEMVRVLSEAGSPFVVPCEE